MKTTKLSIVLLGTLAMLAGAAASADSTTDQSTVAGSIPSTSLRLRTTTPTRWAESWPTTSSWFGALERPTTRQTCSTMRERSESSMNTTKTP